MPAQKVVWVGTSIEAAIVYTLDQIAAFADKYLEGDSIYYIAPTVGAYRGCFSIKFGLANDEFGVATFDVVATDNMPGDKAPIRDAMSYPGFATSYVYQTGHIADTAAYLAFWEDVFLAAKGALIDDATTGTVTGVSVSDKDCLDGSVKTAESTIPIEAESRFYSTHDLARFGAIAIYVADSEAPRFQPDVQVQATVVGASIDTSGVIEAIETIGLQDYDISINHGQSIFSVRGRTLT